jgi:hypothetical protein
MHLEALPRRVAPCRQRRAVAGNACPPGRANLPPGAGCACSPPRTIGVEMPSILTLRPLTALFSHSSVFPENSLLCFHILTNSFSRNLFLLTLIQIAGGCTSLAAQLAEPILEPRLLTHTPPTTYRAHKLRSCCAKSPLCPDHRRRACPEPIRRVYCFNSFSPTAALGWSIMPGMFRRSSKGSKP